MADVSGAIYGPHHQELKSHQALVIGPETVPETSVTFNQLTELIAWKISLILAVVRAGDVILNFKF
jgi:hypothetical protein